MTIGQGPNFELNSLASILNEARTHVRQILSQRFGVNYTNQQPLHQQAQVQPPPLEHPNIRGQYEARQDQGQLNTMCWNPTDRNQRQMMLREFQKLNELVNQAMDNEQRTAHAVWERYARNPTTPQAIHLVRRLTNLHNIVKHISDLTHNLVDGVQRTFADQRNPNSMLEGMMDQCHQVAVQLDLALEARGHTAGVLRNYIQNAEEQLVKQQQGKEQGQQGKQVHQGKHSHQGKHVHHGHHGKNHHGKGH